MTKCWWQYFTIPTQSVRLEQENKAYVKNEQFENRTQIHTLNTVHGCYSDNWYHSKRLIKNGLVLNWELNTSPLLNGDPNTELPWYRVYD